MDKQTVLNKLVSLYEAVTKDHSTFDHVDQEEYVDISLAKLTELFEEVMEQVRYYR